MERIIQNLRSKKVTDRNTAYDELEIVLNKEEFCKNVTDWAELIYALQYSLEKVAEKLSDDRKKTGNNLPTNLKAGDCFIHLIAKAVKYDSDFNIVELIGYIDGCLRIERMKSCFLNAYLIVLKDSILSNSILRGKLTDRNCWSNVLNSLKNLCPAHLGIESNLTICLFLVFKHGLNCGLSQSEYISNFDFIMSLCQGTNSSMPQNTRKDVSQIVLQFLINTASDHRMSCLKLGETLIPTLSNFFEKNKASKINEILLEIFFLQLSIHHPKGVKMNEATAAAHNWQQWQHCLQIIYKLLHREISDNQDQKQNSLPNYKIRYLTNLDNPKFFILFAEISRQIFDLDDLNLSIMHMQKKQKLDINMTSYIDNISNDTTWIWIEVVNIIIKKYPDELSSDNFISLLTTLHQTQTKCKSNFILKCVYECFCTLDDIESEINISSNLQRECDKLWALIAEYTLGAIKVDQTMENANKLLRQLVNKKVMHHEQILHIYLSPKDMTLLPENLKTLEVVLRNTYFPKSSVDKKFSICDRIIGVEALNNRKDLSFLCRTELAQILVGLMLNNWPDFTKFQNISESNESDMNRDVIKEICDIYAKVNFKRTENTQIFLSPNELDKSTSLDPICENHLIKSLNNAVDNFKDSNVESLFNLMVLYLNISYYLTSLNVKSEILKLNYFENTFNSDVVINSFNVEEKMKEARLKSLIRYISTLNELFSFDGNKELCIKVRQAVPIPILIFLSNFARNTLEERKGDADLDFLYNNSIQVLLKYSRLYNNEILAQSQMLQAIFELYLDSYNFYKKEDTNFVLSILNFVKKSEIGAINQEIIRSLITAIKSICQYRYSCYDTVIKILDSLHDIFPHLINSSDEDIKTAINLLYPFKKKILNYGPKASVRFLKCISVLCQTFPTFEHLKWNVDEQEIIYCVPKFLASDFQEIRFEAIETLLNFFKIPTNSLCQFHRQELVFDKLCNVMSSKLFEISGEINEERTKDESMNRTVTVLHTFLSIITNCDLWIEESLVALIRIAKDKKLETKNYFSIIAEQFNVAQLDFIRKYLKSILIKWTNSDTTINDFPFFMVNCNNKDEFYRKYFDILAPLCLLQPDIQNKFHAFHKENAQVTEEIIVKVFVMEILNHYQVKFENFTHSPAMKFLISYLGSEDNLKLLLLEKIHVLLLELINLITDNDCIKERFQENVFLSKKNLLVIEFTECLSFVKTYLKIPHITKYLITDQLPKLDNILLNLRMCIMSAFTSIEKILALHRYSVFCNILPINYNIDKDFKIYFIRQTILFILNFINANQSNRFGIIGCRFLLHFLKDIIPLHVTLMDCGVEIINSIKKFANNPNLRSACIGILKFLLVDNTDHFRDILQICYHFPDERDYDEINLVCTNISNSKLACDVGQIAKECGNYNKYSMMSSLVHIKNKLSLIKPDIISKYKELHKMIAIPKDSSYSDIHSLVQNIIEMANKKCDNEEYNHQAIYCLGEIGPASLNTLSLQPEIETPNTELPPTDLITAYIISYTMHYLNDSDIEVVKLASESLLRIFLTKEAKIVCDLEVNVGKGNINVTHLCPFYPKDLYLVAANLKIVNDNFLTYIKDDNLWVPENVTHEEWIVKLVKKLLSCFHSDCYFSELSHLCQKKIEFCELMFKLIIFFILSTKDKKAVVLVTTQISKFFQVHWDLIWRNDKDSKSICLNKKSVQSMLNMVDFNRLQKSFELAKKPLMTLDLNYLHVAKAAEYCSEYFLTLFYTELWCNKKQEMNKLEIRYLKTMLDCICENEDEENSNALQSILRNAYKSIGERDAIPGCGNLWLLNPQSRVDHYKDMGQWLDVTHFYDCQIEDPTSKIEILKSMQKLGWHGSANFFGSQLFDNEFTYECLWRLSQWDEVPKCGGSNFRTHDLSKIRNISRCPDNEFEKYRFESLRAIHENDEFAFSVATKNALNSIRDKIKVSNVGICSNLYEILSYSQAILEIKEFGEAANGKGFEDIFNKWEMSKDLNVFSNCSHIEPILMQRIVMLNDRIRYFNPELKDIFVNQVFNFIDWARSEGKLNAASRALHILNEIENLDEVQKLQLKLEDAQLEWAADHKPAALILVNQLTKADINNEIRVVALRLNGQWMAETQSVYREEIKESFLSSLYLSEKLPENWHKQHQHVSIVLKQMATFADRQYQEIRSHINSDVFKLKEQNMEKFKKTAEAFKKEKVNLEHQKAAHLYLERSKIDKLEIDTTLKEKDDLLQMALKYYLKFLIDSDVDDMQIFRVFSLLLENRQNPIINPMLSEDLQKIPSYKYVSILPQLIPHINLTNKDPFNAAITAIVEKCAKDHPHHTLPLLLALKKSNKDTKSASGSSGDDLEIAATSLIRKLKKIPHLTEIIEKMDNLFVALIRFAYLKCDRDGKRFSIPSSESINKISHFNEIPLPTVKIPINQSGNYESVIGIVRFDAEYEKMGGLNQPKKIDCLCTDGAKRTILVKGNDDLRQDAVMQQVFNIMNELLSANKSTKNLRIRTYKIVPLSKRSGIMEFAVNSMEIGSYLINAHETYRPQDMLPTKCRKMLIEASKKSYTEKLKVYNQICSKIKPVFHKFFETTFPHALEWYQRRRAYIFSVATTSMCGYILGIGDRHVNNILVDKTTAELIHIDFGIAFDMGKELKTPETVPFRLTRDIVDGMGVSGVEGLFRHSCEKTMEVLRKNGQTITTILEVLLYDPLYAWSITPEEANKRQKDDIGQLFSLNGDSSKRNTNITAERALWRLKLKLQGLENGKTTSVENQVAVLIQEAMSPANLSKLFNGWQAYL